MKRVYFYFLIFLFPVYVFSSSYRINEVVYDIKPSKIAFLGKTSEYALEQQVAIDKTKVFETEDDLKEYIDLYKQNLKNLRAFDELDVTYKIEDDENLSITDNSNINVTLYVNLTDSLHILGLPHIISYNSNEGWKPKLKLKDTNFLGTLNTLSTDFYGVLDFENKGQSNSFGFDFDFDYPFKAGIFDAKLLNDYTLSFTFADKSPEWNLSTGLLFSKSYKNFSACFEIQQNEIRNLDYKSFNDETYFNEYAKVYFPISLLQTDNFGKLIYTPSLSITYNWDFDGISVENTSLSSPTFSFANSLSFGKLNWFNTMRKGFTASLTNSYNYNFQRNIFYPYLEYTLQGSYFIPCLDGIFLNKIGINARLINFYYFESSTQDYFYGTSIGSYLRGIRDSQFFGNNSPQYTASDAIIMNLDLPIHFLTFRFNQKLLSYFNCEVHISPFLDIALTKNRITNRFFSLKDGFYSTGLEVLVYPQKWSSFTVRGSIGFDLSKTLFSNYVDNEWRSNTSLYEISLGLGLFY